MKTYGWEETRYAFILPDPSFHSTRCWSFPHPRSIPQLPIFPGQPPACLERGQLGGQLRLVVADRASGADNHRQQRLDVPILPRRGGPVPPAPAQRRRGRSARLGQGQGLCVTVPVTVGRGGVADPGLVFELPQLRLVDAQNLGVRAPLLAPHSQHRAHQLQQQRPRAEADRNRRLAAGDARAPESELRDVVCLRDVEALEADELLEAVRLPNLLNGEE